MAKLGDGIVEFEMTALGEDGAPVTTIWRGHYRDVLRAIKEMGDQGQFQKFLEDHGIEQEDA